MDIIKAHLLARTLIREHLPSYWSFQWNNARTVHGHCDYNTNSIVLSRVLTAVNDEAQVRDTILHEIAHALAGHEAGHGIRWQRQARAIGARPLRLAEESTGVRETAPWVGTCPNGHTSKTRFFRKPRNQRACGVCSPGKFDPRFIITYSRVDSLVGAR